MKSEKKNMFYTADRQVWRAWLAEHYQTENEIWFVFPTKDSGEESLSYNDAVEEALCFGWIDSTAGKLDETHGIRRFCPRREGAAYSRPNIERLIWLDQRDMILPQVRKTVADLLATPYEFPTDILDAIKKDETTWKNYRTFSAPYQRIRIAYIDAARHRPEEFAKRLKNFIAKTRENKLIVGYGGVDKYYKVE